MLKDQLTMEQSIVTALQKSAEGIVGRTLAAEGLNKSRKVFVGEVIIMINSKYKRAVLGFFLIVMLNSCGESAGLKIENDFSSEILLKAVFINGKNILFAPKNLPPRNNRYSPEGHISGAVLSGEEVLSIETSINGAAVTSKCQIPKLIGEGSCYQVFAYFNGTETMKCTYVCDNLYEGL